MTKSYQIRVDQTQDLAQKLAKTITGGEVFALIGELGSGKTTFTKHLGKALGIKNNITSPTFIIMQEYATQIKSRPQDPMFLYHLDLYRAHTEADVETLGLTEIWNQPNTITVIEWADKIKKLLPKKTTYIYFEPNDQHSPN